MKTTIISKKDHNLGYIQFIPKDFNPEKKYPLFIYQHGNGSEDGESYGGVGSDSALTHYLNVKSHLPYYLKEDRLGFEVDAIVVCPQIKNGWLEGKAFENFINHLNQTYNPLGIAIMGISAGGSSAWKAVRDYGNLIDVSIPMAGAMQYKIPVDPLAVSVWAFHGKNDNVIDVRYTSDNISLLADVDKKSYEKSYRYSLKQSDPNPQEDITMVYDHITQSWVEVPLNDIDPRSFKATIYKNGGHGIMGKVFKTEAMWKWAINEILIKNEGGNPNPNPDPTIEEVIRDLEGVITESRALSAKHDELMRNAEILLSKL